MRIRYACIHYANAHVYAEVRKNVFISVGFIEVPRKFRFYVTTLVRGLKTELQSISYQKFYDRFTSGIQSIKSSYEFRESPGYDKSYTFSGCYFDSFFLP